MSKHPQTLSVTQAAELCGVGRTTVGYWVRSKKLRAERSGRNYSIPVEELLFYLQSTGQKVPHELTGGYLQTPVFRSIVNCWDYWQGSAHGQNCVDCTVFTKQLEVCFTARESGLLRCPETCDACIYYKETYFPRIQFVHQIDLSAAVYKDLCCWGGNAKSLELCGINHKKLIGMGIDHVIHPDSLDIVVAGMRRRVFENTAVPRTYIVYLKNKRHGKLKVRSTFYPLCNPPETFLILTEPYED